MVVTWQGFTGFPIATYKTLISSGFFENKYCMFKKWKDLEILECPDLNHSVQ